MLPLLTTELTDQLVGEALETVSCQDVRDWQEKALGTSAQKRRRRITVAIKDAKQAAAEQDTKVV